nr:N-acetyltransferase 6 isoform X2 [Vanessa tameamea]XP_026498908.1 N-acetyltransferase 6 isoform X2 [Vanessa tameamea]
MEHKGLQVLQLHRYPQYLKPCCKLINEEWPRSETARMMSLEASCDQLPTSLILINADGIILGHCKLTPIPSIPNSCFIETVVISKSMRGQKLGTYLMKEVEKYCKNVLKLEMVHLSTKGQENFYAKLGYEFCAPISIYGNSVVSNNIAKDSKTKNDVMPTKIGTNKTAPPPPPMPQPVIIQSTIKTSKTYMFKYLS